VTANMAYKDNPKGKDAAPDPETMSIPLNCTPAQINEQNRKLWSQDAKTIVDPLPRYPAKGAEPEPYQVMEAIERHARASGKRMSAAEMKKLMMGDEKEEL
jgi:hypothetical protein